MTQARFNELMRLVALWESDKKISCKQDWLWARDIKECLHELEKHGCIDDDSCPIGCTDKDDTKCKWIDPDIGRCPCSCHNQKEDSDGLALDTESKPIPVPSVIGL